jgi:hypothetical protein
MSSYLCKGAHIIQSRNWVNEKLGPGTFEGLVADAGPNWRANFLPSTWYEVAPLAQALKHVAPQVKMSVQDVTREIARRNALNDLKTFYRVFLSIVAPVRVMSFTPQLWSTYVKFGVSRAIRNEQGHYVGECTGIPEQFIDWVCGAWLGFVPTTIEVAGGKNVRGTIIKRWAEPSKPGEFGIHCEVLYTK